MARRFASLSKTYYFLQMAESKASVNVLKYEIFDYTNFSLSRSTIPTCYNNSYLHKSSVRM